MNQLLNFGEIVAMNAYVSPDKVGARDLTRSLTFRGWNDRSCKLANALVGLGLEKGDRVAVLAYNCLEWMEIYAAVAKAGPADLRESNFVRCNMQGRICATSDWRQLYQVIIAANPQCAGALARFL
jgi:acyl-coenzyme A synthetase/AMP-(fatty) acid ligase